MDIKTLPNKKIVTAISKQKNEPAWAKNFRLQALSVLYKKKLPSWGIKTPSNIFEDLTYYLPPLTKKARTWDDIPLQIRETYEKLGIHKNEQSLLAGINAQYDSEAMYQELQKTWEKQGVIFLDTDTAIQQHPDLVKKYLGTIIPAEDNFFSALNSAVFSGGSFLYVPKNVFVEIPVQAYFRINTKRMGQFERTLIIADEGSFVHYIEGCSAPLYTTDSLHAGVVEILVKKNARVKYTTIQNWSTNVYNFVTKRMIIEENGIGEFIDGNIGSKATMKYPSVILQGRQAKGTIISLSIAKNGQQQDTGGKAIHLAPHTSSTIISKSLSMQGGITNYRGTVIMKKGAKQSTSFVKCDGLLLDNDSKTETYPLAKIEEKEVNFSHEATVGNIGKEQLFYLMSRGLSEEQATELIVHGFIDPIIQELPFEYAIELNRLLSLALEKK